ncbi:MAG: hypothetical protein P8124_08120 [Gammaproteobacteria bacterium]
MNLELTEEQTRIVHHALEVYLADLREEIAKTERHEWRAGLHNEEAVIRQVLEKIE